MRYETLWQPLTKLYDADEAKAIARMVLEVGFGLTWTDIVTGQTETIDDEALQTIQKRLLEGEPVQYVLGIAEFCGRQFKVAPGVLIPRPETGELCGLIKEVKGEFLRPCGSKRAKLERKGSYRFAQELKGQYPAIEDEPYSILDIGTGSGCIAITLALELPQARVTAWDISEDALRIAQQNAKILGADVTFEKKDILKLHLEEQNISLTSHLSPLTSKYSLIVSNPPYVCEREKKAMAQHVLAHEPHLALFVPDDDPLRFYRAIAHYAQASLKPDGLLYFELNPLYARETEAMLKDMGFAETKIKLDMFGKQRFLKAKKI